MNINCLIKLESILILAVVLISAPLTYAQDQTGTVNGYVRKSGNPYSWIKIVVTSHALASYEGVGYTDEKGYFSLSGVPVGGEVEVIAFNNSGTVYGEAVGELNNSGETISINIDIGQSN